MEIFRQGSWRSLRGSIVNAENVICFENFENLYSERIKEKRQRKFSLENLLLAINQNFKMLYRAHSIHKNSLQNTERVPGSFFAFC